MNLWLLVPVKPFDQSKSRLADVLTPAERAALSRRMLAHLLTTAQTTNLMAGMLVVSRDRAVLDFARSCKADALAESGDDLNIALRQASQWARSAGADAVLVLPADLPLITVEDMRQLCVLARSGVDVVLAASRDGGTNALYLRLPSVVDFQFGPDSFERHRQLAAAARATVAIYQSPTIALDLDRPEDLLALGEQFRPVPGDC